MTTIIISLHLLLSYIIFTSLGSGQRHKLEQQQQQPYLFFERHQWKHKQSQKHKVLNEFVHKLRDKAHQHGKLQSASITHAKNTATLSSIKRLPRTSYCNVHR